MLNHLLEDLPASGQGHDNIEKRINEIIKVITRICVNSYKHSYNK